MTGKEYLRSLVNVKKDKKKAKKISDIYTNNLPDIIMKIVSNGEKTIFLDNGIRALSYDEIVDAERDLHVEFGNNGMIPLFDCGENDFIVYHFSNDKWSKFNIVDKVVFKTREKLEDLV